VNIKKTFQTDEEKTAPEMAEIFGCSKETIKRNLRENGIRLRDKYSDLSDEDLKKRIEDIVDPKLDIGEITVDSHLKVDGLLFQRSRIRKILKICKAKMKKNKRRPPLIRRRYRTRGPRSMLHMDGYLKLIRYNVQLLFKLRNSIAIIKHGCIKIINSHNADGDLLYTPQSMDSHVCVTFSNHQTTIGLKQFTNIFLNQSTSSDCLQE